MGVLTLTAPAGLSRLILKATPAKDNLKELGSLATVSEGPGRMLAFEKWTVEHT